MIRPRWWKHLCWLSRLDAFRPGEYLCCVHSQICQEAEDWRNHLPSLVMVWGIMLLWKTLVQNPCAGPYRLIRTQDKNRAQKLHQHAYSILKGRIRHGFPISASAEGQAYADPQQFSRRGGQCFFAGKCLWSDHFLKLSWNSPESVRHLFLHHSREERTT